ncbi:membrane protein insertion efficiency factor YidD [Mesoflavibacter zeaxanthinifaciens]|uniref:membrane protein insertion efficiency factor YidD n=1 Tax=Mesoflavibacter zeaxanthinifaciens TaxID=393060 RepID=UPI003A9091B2
MKQFLLIIIKIYWLTIPKSSRRRCLFQESCSNHVYRITKNEGLISGLKALRFRIRNCNSNYAIIKIDNKPVLISSSNKLFDESEINYSILNQVSK